ncbi:hypothetical protein L2D24_18155, partial [Escherichia coli]
LHDDPERRYQSLSAGLKEQQDDTYWLRSGYYRSNTGIALIFIVLALNIITPVIPRIPVFFIFYLLFMKLRGKSQLR